MVLFPSPATQLSGDEKAPDGWQTSRGRGSRPSAKFRENATVQETDSGVSTPSSFHFRLELTRRADRFYRRADPRKPRTQEA